MQYMVSLEALWRSEICMETRNKPSSWPQLPQEDWDEEMDGATQGKPSQILPFKLHLLVLSGLTASESDLSLSEPFCCQDFLEAESYISCPFAFGLIHSEWCLRFSAVLSHMSEFLSLLRLSNTPSPMFWNCLTVSMNPSHNLWKLKLKTYL